MRRLVGPLNEEVGNPELLMHGERYGQNYIEQN